MAVLDKKIQVLMLKGQAAKVSIGRVTTVTSSTPASVTNSGTTGDAVFDFEIPQGRAGTLEIGTVTTVTSSTPASVTNSGTPDEAVLDFEIPQGKAATIDVGRVTTGAAGTNASITNRGTNEEAVFDFTIPKGDPGATVTTYTATIPVSGWSSTVPYTQTVSVSGILSSDTPIIDVNLSADTNTAITQLDAWACVSKITTSIGSLTITCLEEKPTTNIPIQLKVVR